MIPTYYSQPATFKLINKQLSCVFFHIGWKSTLQFTQLVHCIKFEAQIHINQLRFDAKRVKFSFSSKKAVRRSLMCMIFGACFCKPWEWKDFSQIFREFSSQIQHFHRNQAKISSFLSHRFSFLAIDFLFSFAQIEWRLKPEWWFELLESETRSVYFIKVALKNTNSHKQQPGIRTFCSKQNQAKANARTHNTHTHRTRQDNMKIESQHAWNLRANKRLSACVDILLNPYWNFKSTCGVSVCHFISTKKRKKTFVRRKKLFWFSFG